MKISPRYKINLIKQIKDEIWKLCSSYAEVSIFFDEWKINEAFDIALSNDGKIQVLETLNGISTETLIKIAIDLDIETPDFIPSIPMCIFR